MGIRALYAEDELSNRKYFEILLKRNGFEVDVAADGLEAATLAEANEYDVILLDHHMPKATGEQAARRIRRTRPRVPLICVTSDDSHADALLDAGFDKVLIKPLVGRDCLEMIRSLLASASPEGAGKAS